MDDYNRSLDMIDNMMSTVLGDNKIFTQYHASTHEIIFHVRDNFFNLAVFMQIRR